MIEVTIRIEGDIRTMGASKLLPARIKPAGFSVAARCCGWGRDPNGTVRLSIRAEVRSPPGMLKPYVVGGGS
jgi:hypothetical protein